MAVIGRLDRRVEIQEQAITRDALGGESVDWVNVAKVWAGYMQTAARRRLRERRRPGRRHKAGPLQDPLQE